jgi:hypothetical protein
MNGLKDVPLVGDLFIDCALTGRKNGSSDFRPLIAIS